MNKKILISAFLMILLSIWLVNAIVSVKYITPDDGFYLIKGGGVTGNISFEINASPSSLSGSLQNATLWTNISGTWSANYTNYTAQAINTAIIYRFHHNGTNIFSRDLTDGLVFVWNVIVYDNITIFPSESVAMDTEGYGMVFDNHTNTTGDGLCVNPGTDCNYSIRVRGSKGFLANSPVNSIFAVKNSTGEMITGACNMTNLATGQFYCNQTIQVWNGTATQAKQTLTTSVVTANYSIVLNARFAGANRTVYVEDAPTITLNLPLDNGYDSDGTVPINITVVGDGDTYQCLIYSNDTGSWVQEAGAFTATNNTDKLTSKVFTEGNVVWNARCAESLNSNIYGWATSNRTVTIDKTDPSVTLNFPLNLTYQDNRTLYFNATVTDSNIANCNIYFNSTSTNWNASNYNETITSMSSGVRFNFSQKLFDSDYNIIWGVSCNDSAGRIGWSSNYTVSMDSFYPAMRNNSNYTSTAANCKGITMEFISTEAVNLSFRYGLTSISETWETIETDFAINQTVTLTFNESYDTTFYANVTICDRAGNCNGTGTTYEEMLIESPIGLCTEWSYWSIYDSRISLVNLSDDSGADFVYWWNNSGQSWTSYSSASTGQGPYNLKIGDVVHFYESTNTTYFRNVTGSPDYFRNVTAGHIYFGLYDSYSLGNISHILFRNSTGGNRTINESDYYGADNAGGLEFQIDDLAGFNNTNQEYVSSIFTWDWNNLTAIGTGPKNGIDTLWAYFPFNLTINFTTNGNIRGNWT
ncbi:hypothetical protein LCGC14_0598540 [marine sediment metagenome]|uniref:Uncharacterized protein n=1 Tax=marine sediment metagenome TaxID=412755 RepID=A0A0F9UJS6_9ZZZZ